MFRIDLPQPSDDARLDRVVEWLASSRAPDASAWERIARASEDASFRRYFRDFSDRCDRDCDGRAAAAGGCAVVCEHDAFARGGWRACANAFRFRRSARTDRKSVV